MKVLHSAQKTIDSILGKQTYQQGCVYRKSNYKVEVMVEKGTLLYHTLTGELLLLEKTDTVENQEEVLIQHRYLVPLTYQEDKTVREIRDLLRRMYLKKTITSFTVFTTTDCNARCFYCYEKGRSRIPMMSQTAHAVAAYIGRVSQGEKVKLSWFGGEPLFNQEAIRIICNDLSQKGIQISSSMASNGYYLTAEVINKAKRDWNLKNVQITLDGTEAVYNRIKAYTDAIDNPYRRVLDNIELCIQSEIKVAIRINVNQANTPDIFALCKQLSDRFGQNKFLSVYAAPIRNAKGQTTEADKESVLCIEQKLLETGLCHQGKLSNAFKVNRCMADDDSSITILPDGRIGKCEHYSETETIGSIYTDKQDHAAIQSWKEQMEDQEECKTCPLYPRCIRLKKCEWEKFGCSEADRQLKIQRLKDQIAKFQPEQEWRQV